jgi:hypothetical protein
VQFNINSFEHGVQIIRDFRIPESDDTIAFPLKPKLPFTIALGGFIVIMMSSVEFDDQVCGRTEKVHDVRTDRRLAAEVCTQQGSSFSARHNTRSCGVVLARSLLAVARRIAVEIMFISH